MSDGTFKKSKGFTVVYNTAARDKRLSEKALGLYTRIASYITLPDEQITKSKIMGWCSCGTKSFERAWQELKDCGYLIQRMQSGAGREWKVEYELLTTPREDGIHTFYLNAAGEITNTNLSRKTNKGLAAQENEQNSQSEQNDVTPETDIALKVLENDVTPKTGITSEMPENRASRRYTQNGYNVKGDNVKGGNDIKTNTIKTNDINIINNNNNIINHHPHTEQEDDLSTWHEKHPPDEDVDAIIRLVLKETEKKDKVNIGNYKSPYWVTKEEALNKIYSLSNEQVAEYMTQFQAYEQPVASPGRFHLVGLYNQAGVHRRGQARKNGFHQMLERGYDDKDFAELERQLCSVR